MEKNEIFVLPDFCAWFLQVIFRDSCIATCVIVQWNWWSRWL